jgi:hypothetical protein
MGQGMGRCVLVLAALTVAACGPLPRPFRTAPEKPFNPLVTEVAALGVMVEPIDGTSLPMSRLLTEAVVEGLKRTGISATTDAGKNSRYRLMGKAELNQANQSLPFVMVIDWILLDYDGKIIGEASEGISGSRKDWEYGSPKIIAEVGENAPKLIVAMIGEEEKGQQAVKPRLAGLWVGPVTNAPGDGNRSLARAIKIALKGGGIALAQDREHAEFVLESRVRVDPAKDSLQRVEIVWTVSTPDNREIGRATQRNLVEAGTFSGAWGEVAAIVAAAALEGIEGVLRVAGASLNRFGPLAKVLKTDIPLADGKVLLPPPRLDLEGLAPASKRP